MNTIETLQKMKGIIMERGWIKGRLIDYKGGVCLVGARNLAAGMEMWNEHGQGNYSRCEITDLIESTMPDHMTGYNTSLDETIAYRVNDAAQSVNEVLALIDDTIIIAKERGLT